MASDMQVFPACDVFEHLSVGHEEEAVPSPKFAVHHGKAENSPSYGKEPFSPPDRKLAPALDDHDMENPCKKTDKLEVGSEKPQNSPKILLSPLDNVKDGSENPSNYPRDDDPHAEGEEKNVNKESTQCSESPVHGIVAELPEEEYTTGDSIQVHTAKDELNNNIQKKEGVSFNSVCIIENGTSRPEEDQADEDSNFTSEEKLALGANFTESKKANLETNFTQNKEDERADIPWHDRANFTETCEQAHGNRANFTETCEQAQGNRANFKKVCGQAHGNRANFTGMCEQAHGNRANFTESTKDSLLNVFHAECDSTINNYSCLSGEGYHYFSDDEDNCSLDSSSTVQVELDEVESDDDDNSREVRGEESNITESEYNEESDTALDERKIIHDTEWKQSLSGNTCIFHQTNCDYDEFEKALLDTKPSTMLNIITNQEEFTSSISHEITVMAIPIYEPTDHLVVLNVEQVGVVTQEEDEGNIPDVDANFQDHLIPAQQEVPQDEDHDDEIQEDNNENEEEEEDEPHFGEPEENTLHQDELQGMHDLGNLPSTALHAINVHLLYHEPDG